MAKAGFWMRGARGKLAGASFAKGQNGQTIQREIKTPRNPNSNPQLFQRAIMATIMRAYSAGKKVFDHSYEGISVGSKCQQKFMRDNLKTLRSKLFAEYSAGGSLVDMTARVIGRGGINPVANEYKISEGTLVNNVLTTQNGKDYVFTGADTADLTVAGWLQQAGVVEDDIFTVCAFLNNPERIVGGYEGVEAAQYVAGVFAWVRMEVKLSAFTDNSLISEASISDVFDIVENNSLNGFNGDALISAGFNASTWGNGYNAGASACIRSRKNSILRSTANMISFNENEHDYGIKAPYITALWTKGATTLGDSDLLLEGGDGAQQAPTHPSSPTILSYSKAFPISTDDAPFQIVMSEDVTPELVAPSLKLYYNDGSVKAMNGNLLGNEIVFKEASAPAWRATVNGNVITVRDVSQGHANDIVSAFWVNSQPLADRKYQILGYDNGDSALWAARKSDGKLFYVVDENGDNIILGSNEFDTDGSLIEHPEVQEACFDYIEGSLSEDSTILTIEGEQYVAGEAFYFGNGWSGLSGYTGDGLFIMNSADSPFLMFRKNGKYYISRYLSNQAYTTKIEGNIASINSRGHDDMLCKYDEVDCWWAVDARKADFTLEQARAYLASIGITAEESYIYFSDDESTEIMQIPCLT